MRAGQFSPGGGAAPLAADFAAFASALADADAALATVTEAEMEAFIGGTTVFAFRDTKMPFRNEDFLLSFSQPNFYFHATMVYAIFRARELPLGKMDYMGRPRIAA